jgi:hypothetical protein
MIIAMVLGWLVVMAVVWAVRAGRKDEGWGLGLLYGFIAAIVGGVVGVLVGAAVIPLTGGMLPWYGRGELTGYVVQFERSGFLFKTYDGTILLGVGEQSAVDKPQVFSVTDARVCEQITGLVGRKVRVRLRYDAWVIAPYWVGKHPIVVTEVWVLEDGGVDVEAEETPGR